MLIRGGSSDASVLCNMSRWHRKAGEGEKSGARVLGPRKGIFHMLEIGALFFCRIELNLARDSKDDMRRFPSLEWERRDIDVILLVYLPLN